MKHTAFDPLLIAGVHYTPGGRVDTGKVAELAILRWKADPAVRASFAGGLSEFAEALLAQAGALAALPADLGLVYGEHYRTGGYVDLGKFEGLLAQGWKNPLVRQAFESEAQFRTQMWKRARGWEIS